MILKPIKNYKQGKGFRHEITITKQDLEQLNKANKVAILETNEIQKTQNEIKELKNKLIEKDNKISDIKQELTQSLEKNKTLSETLDRIEKLLDKFQLDQNKTIEKIQDKQHQSIKEIEQLHYQQLNETNDKLNKEITKQIAINQLQNTALKQMLELGFLDLIRNKHKKIAKDQIKELDNKKIYELTKG